jgi:SHS2 domain-containing protein
MRYRYLDHTSDLGVEIYGKDLKELFANGLYVLFDNLTDIEKVEEREERELKITAEDLDSLFMDWLRELLFLFATEYFVGKRVKEIEIIENSLSARITGEQFDPKRHPLKIEIKTPTYYLFEVKKEESGYRATVIFDV